jgi:hypothetical protein
MWRFLLPLLLVSSVSADDYLTRLGSDDYLTRKAVRQELAAAGIKVKAILEEGVKSKDPEVRLACEDLLLQVRCEEIWLPTKVKFKPDTKTLYSALGQLPEPIAYTTAYSTIDDLPVTVQDGDFWPVLDDLCRQSKSLLSEVSYGADSRYLSVSRSPQRSTYNGPFRLSLTGVSRMVSSSKYFDEPGQSNRKMELKLDLRWEHRFNLIASKQPKITASTDSGEKIRELPSSSSSSWNLHSGETRQTTFMLSVSPPLLQDKKLSNLKVVVPVIAIGEFGSVPIHTNGEPTVGGVYEVVYHKGEYDSKNSQWKFSVQFLHSLNAKEELEEIYLKPCSIYVENKKGEIVKSVDLLGSNRVDAPSSTESILTYTFNVSKEEFHRLMFSFPTFRSVRDVTFEFDELEIPSFE